ncbi:MAG: hypothetical protein ABEI96_05505 [Haloarculaceae archaeon]
MRTNRRRRSIIAVVLALVYPGLGHVYLREWLRALLWFGLVITSSTLLIPESLVPSSLSPDALVAASEQLPGTTLAILFGITVLSMVDAYWLARKHSDEVSRGDVCPVCGNEIDPELDFCHWCTTRLADEDAS